MNLDRNGRKPPYGEQRSALFPWENHKSMLFPARCRHVFVYFMVSKSGSARSVDILLIH